MPRVFISYSHDNEEHLSRVRRLADLLRATRSLDIALDQYMLPAGPAEGWPHWAESQVREADYVLIVSTEVYCRRYEGRETSGVGLGAVCEGGLIRQMIYDSGGINDRFRVVHLIEGDKNHVPDALKRYHRFPLYQSNAEAELIAWLTGRTPADKSADPADLAWPKPFGDYLWGMADRRDVTGLFERMICGQSNRRILLINGESGLGKTHLLAELRNYCERVRVPCSLLDCKGCLALDDLFQSIFEDLPSIFPTAQTAASRVVHQLRKFGPVVLIFDSYESASTDSQTWLERQLLSRADTAHGLVVVVAGQSVPYAPRHSWANFSEQVPLRPIHEANDWCEYGLRKGFVLPVQDVAVLAKAGQGHPGVIVPLLKNLAVPNHRAEAAGSRQ